MLRLALAQLDLTVGDLAGNRERIADACADAARAGADLVLAPELAIAATRPRTCSSGGVPGRLPAGGRALAGEVEVPLLVGRPWLDGDRVRNSGALLGGEIVARYDKRELPNYGVFDEERTFAAGRGELAFERSAGALAASRSARTSGSPTARSTGGGRRRDGRPQHLGLALPPGQGPLREEMLRTRARDGLCFVAYCNLVGGQDELLFDGRSVVIGPDGDVLARAGAVRGGAADRATSTRPRGAPSGCATRGCAAAAARRLQRHVSSPAAGARARRRSSRGSRSRRRRPRTSSGARSGSACATTSTRTASGGS